MSVIPSGCCCNPANPSCIALDRVCDLPAYIPEYISVGRPRPPRKYYGRYFPAWHNTMSKRGRLFTNITLNITKRTLVQEECVPGGCPAPAGLSTDASCLDPGAIVAAANCKRTVYTDRYIWQVSQILDFKGFSPDQTPYLDAAQNPTASAPPGHLPCGLGLACGSVCANPNAGTIFGPTPIWWNEENRKSLFRFNKANGQVLTSAQPSNLYPQTAACGAIDRVDRCPVSTSVVPTGICLDYPMVILPNDPGLDCNGNPFSCGPGALNNGSFEVLLGMDLVEPNLIAALQAMQLQNGQGIGTWNDFWFCYTSGRVRMLVDVKNRMPTDGSVFKPSAPINFSKTVVLDLGSETWRVSVIVDITPLDWCYTDKECHCSNRFASVDRISRCEFGPSTLFIKADCPVQEDGICGAPGTFSVNMVVGLEGVSRNPFTWDPCFMWNQLPPNPVTAGIFPGTEDYYRFLGGEPVERGHPHWRRYRNRYNHTETINSWYTSTAPGDGFLCVPQRSGSSVTLASGIQFYIDPDCSGQPGGFPGCINIFQSDIPYCNQICRDNYGPTWEHCCSCSFPLQSPPSSGFYVPATAGCYPGRPTNFYGCTDLTLFPDCEKFCSGFTAVNGSIIGGSGGLPPCNTNRATMSCPDDPSFCNPFFSCDTVNPYTMVLNICAAGTFAICGLTGESSALTRSIGSPTTWLLDDWNPTMSCSPVGVYYPKWNTTACLPAFQWQPNNGTQVTIS